MNTDQKNEVFQYTYSAKDQEELRRIREKYLPKEESRLEMLHRLDSKVTQKATMHAIIGGTLGALILGLGMCCCMLWSESVFILGVVVGILGLAVASLAFPLYNRTLKKERARIAPEVLRLTEDLIN